MRNLSSNRNLLIIGIVAMVNALGYGIIIPILYSYTQKFGLTDFQNGLLFALFSVCQFISTPLIGRMSDKYGRKPLLVTSIAGTCVSFLLMAFAPSALFLFLARALDGLTAGNLPVAQAVISDSTAPSERAKGFGIIGASFGFGFIVGPVISSLTSGYSDSLPFLIAAIVAGVGTLMTAFYLPETNKHMGQVRKGKLFDWSTLWHSLFDPNVGVTFIITLLFTLAFTLFTYAFQPYAVKVLGLSVQQISLVFTAIGVMGLITQIAIVPRTIKAFPLRRTFSTSLVFASVAFFLAYLSHSYVPFVGSMMLLSISNGHVQPLINTILSRETDEQSQGTMLGLNTSYASIGQILGPLMGGAAATYSAHLPFLAAALVVLFCLYLSRYVLRPGIAKEHAF